MGHPNASFTRLRRSALDRHLEQVIAVGQGSRRPLAAPRVHVHDRHHPAAFGTLGVVEHVQLGWLQSTDIGLLTRQCQHSIGERLSGLDTAAQDVPAFRIGVVAPPFLGQLGTIVGVANIPSSWNSSMPRVPSPNCGSRPLQAGQQRRNCQARESSRGGRGPSRTALLWHPPRRGIADDLVAEDLTLFSARGIKQGRGRLHLSAVNVRHELILAA